MSNTAFACVLAVLAGLLFLALFLFWTRRSTTGCKQPDTAVESSPIPFLRDMIRLGHIKRLAMRPRYVPKTTDRTRSEIMAAQILADQETVHEEAGEVAHVPAPGEPGYREPRRAISKRVGQFHIRVERDGTVLVAEIAPHGAESPFYPVPREWSELVAVLLVEIACR